MSVLERFEAKFLAEPNSGCWLWMAAYDGQGYGRFGLHNGRYLRSTQAQRVAWILYNGPVPDGTSVLHKCDTPACVNPAHLFLGTQADNIADMWAKGRAVTPMGKPELAKTHCPQGHPYSGGNLYLWSTKKRKCRTCTNIRQREYNARRKEKVPPP